MPNQDAVLAITSGVSDMQAVLNLVWDCLLPEMQPAALPANPTAQEALKRRLAHLALTPVQGQPSSPIGSKVSGKTYAFAANDQQLESVSVTFENDGAMVTLRDGNGTHEIACGYDTWRKGSTTLNMRRPGNAQPVAASSAWTADDTLVVKQCFYETPFIVTATFRFAGDEVALDIAMNVGFGPTARPQVVGRAQSA
jgi:hypothetical protein